MIRFVHSSFIIIIITHQTHYEKSDWSRAFNQFTIACELGMINAISAADIAFIMSSSTSAWLLKPLGVFSSETKWLNASLLFLRMNYVKNVCEHYLPQPLASVVNTDLGFDNSWYHALPHPIIVYYHVHLKQMLAEVKMEVFQSSWYKCFTNDLFKMKTKRTFNRPIWLTKDRWKPTNDWWQWPMTNLTGVLQPIPLRLHWPITMVWHNGSSSNVTQNREFVWIG